jgi:hypothetical protein
MQTERNKNIYKISFSLRFNSMYEYASTVEKYALKIQFLCVYILNGIFVSTLCEKNPND